MASSSSTTPPPAAPSSFTPFQKHLFFFAAPPAPHRTSPTITLTSALRASLRLGLNFPSSVFLALALRLLYAPFPYYWRPVAIAAIPRAKLRTQLEASDAALVSRAGKTGYTCGELLGMADHAGNSGRKGLVARMIDKGHVVGFWSMAASVETNLVAEEDLARFRRGEWGEAVVTRRRYREGGPGAKRTDIGGEVLPFWRGGPFSVVGHSWAVRKVLGVRVYEKRAS